MTSHTHYALRQTTLAQDGPRRRDTTHWLLYAVLIVMPLSGYIMSAGDKPPISLFGLVDVPKIPVSPARGKVAAIVHVLVTQFILYGLIVLHLVGTAWHLFVRHDGALSRMLPKQANECD